MKKITCFSLPQPIRQNCGQCCWPRLSLKWPTQSELLFSPAESPEAFHSSHGELGNTYYSLKLRGYKEQTQAYSMQPLWFNPSISTVIRQWYACHYVSKNEMKPVISSLLWFPWIVRPLLIMNINETCRTLGSCTDPFFPLRYQLFHAFWVSQLTLGFILMLESFFLTGSGLHLIGIYWTFCTWDREVNSSWSSLNPHRVPFANSSATFAWPNIRLRPCWIWWHTGVSMMGQHDV